MGEAIRIGLFVIAVSSVAGTAHAQTPAATPMSAEQAAQLSVVRSQRELSVGLWASGGILLTGGGFGMFGYVFPGNGFFTLVVCAGVAAIGLGLIVAAAAVGTGAHARWQQLRDAGLVLGPDGVGLLFSREWATAPHRRRGRRGARSTHASCGGVRDRVRRVRMQSSEIDFVVGRQHRIARRATEKLRLAELHE
jgi:hypothetical protein